MDNSDWIGVIKTENEYRVRETNHTRFLPIGYRRLSIRRYLCSWAGIKLMGGCFAWSVESDSDGLTYVNNSNGESRKPGAIDSSCKWSTCEFTDEICGLLEDLGYFYDLRVSEDGYRIELRGPYFMPEGNYEVIAKDRLMGINESLNEMISRAKSEMLAWNIREDLAWSRMRGIK
jgi:hypothetical protein